MNVKDVTFNLTSSINAVMIAANMAPPLPTEAIKLLRELAKIDNDAPFLFQPEGKGSAYLPRFYNLDGKAVLKWGDNIRPLSEFDPAYVDITFEVSEATGYRGVHCTLVFSQEPLDSDPDDIYLMSLPVAVSDKANFPQFLSLVRRNPDLAFSQFVSAPYTPKLKLDSVFLNIQGTDELEVVVVGYTWNYHVDTPYVIADVTVPSWEKAGEVFACNVSKSVQSMITAPILKTPMKLPGVVKRSKVNLNVVSVGITEGDLDLSKL